MGKPQSDNELQLSREIKSLGSAIYLAMGRYIGRIRSGSAATYHYGAFIPAEDSIRTHC